MKYEEACFGAGCFWSIQAEFDQVKGVIETLAGYAGGHTKNPNYKQVCSDSTGHAEVVYIKFNPQIIKYEKLLDIFFKIH